VGKEESHRGGGPVTCVASLEPTAEQGVELNDSQTKRPADYTKSHLLLKNSF